MSPAGAATVGEALQNGERALRAAGIPTPRLEAEVLLSHVLDTDRVRLIVHDDDVVEPAARGRFEDLIACRERGHPLAYLRGFREFYGLDIAVNPAVLVPRPETELLVEWALEIAAELARPLRVADLGTGSGCIAVAVAKQLVDARIDAVDVSADALAVAAENAAVHGVAGRVHFHEGDLLAPLATRESRALGPFDVMVSNPPYVAVDDPALEPDVARHEPALALLDPYEGDGLGFYRRLAREAQPFLADDGALLVEMGDDQHEAVAAIFAPVFSRIEVRVDLAGIPRSALLRR